MSKILLREQAIQLRLKGNTYTQIQRSLGIAKGTLSNWLKNLPLSEEQSLLLTKNKNLSRDLAIEKYRTTRHSQRLDKLKRILSEQEKILFPLTEKELFVAGLFLYWGEGGKDRGQLTVSNTNPKVVKFALFWMTHILKIPVYKIKVALHLYKDMDIKKSIAYWSETLDLPKDQFNKPYIKKSNREGLTYKNFGYGTCKLYHGSVLLSDQIAMSIKAISDKYGVKSDIFWYN